MNPELPEYPPGGQFNVGYLCTDAQCERGLGGRAAMRFIAPNMEKADYTYEDLRRASSRFANVLRGLDYAPGDIFFAYLPKCPEQFFALLGALKAQVITGPLFSTMGEEALLDRLGDSRAKGILTKKSLLRKLAPIRAKLPALKHVMILEDDPGAAGEGIMSYARLMQEAAPEFRVAPTPRTCPSLLHYTSGSTGKPKGVLHVHGGVLAQRATARDILGIRDGDRYWCTADTGWVTGTSYGIIGPWSLGVEQVHFGGPYNPEQWFRILQDEKITVWYSAPTALRMLMREEPEFFRQFDLTALRQISSVGEPLNPEIVHWGRQVLGKDIHDTWFQTETGAIMIANRPGIAIKPGSMGKPAEGIEAAIVSDEGEVLGEGTAGNLCLRPGWASMFSAYLNNEAAYASKFKAGYYFSGDRAYRDRDGYYWFVGRGDDVINTAGHLIGPFEIESAQLDLGEVAEAAAIGVPDELLHEKVVAFVCLHKGVEASREVELKIRLHVSNRVSSIATPQEVVFTEDIPKNKAGKIMRRLIKARYTGAEIGDISTMEI